MTTTEEQQVTPEPESAPAPPPLRKSHRNLYFILAIVGALVVGIGVGYASGHSAGTGSATPQVTKTVTVDVPGGTQTTTVTVTPSPPTPAGPATSIPTDASGVYVVGQDIQAGTWHTTGADPNDPSGNCYYALLSSTNTNNIIDNNNVTGPATVTIGSGVVAFETNGCAGWTKE